jgi:hypothetical protein
LLPALGAPGKQDNQRVAVAAEVDPIAGSELDPVLEHTGPDRFGVGEIALRHPGDDSGHPRTGLQVEILEPVVEGTVAVLVVPIVPYMLLCNVHTQLSRTS